MIEIKNLVKYFGDVCAVNDVSFTVNDGEILGLVGPNGAGKTTTLNILTGYLPATTGQVMVNGHDLQENPREAKRCIGYLPEKPPLYEEMTVYEYLLFVAGLKDVPRDARVRQLAEIMRRVRLTEVAGRLIRNLSKGHQMRLGIAQALVGNPPVIVLDEPTSGLDPRQVTEIHNLVRELGRQHTVILSSHILAEIQTVCDRLIMINNGSIVEIRSPDPTLHPSQVIFPPASGGQKGRARKGGRI